jgi:hypothetical protein
MLAAKVVIVFVQILETGCRRNWGKLFQTTLVAASCLAIARNPEAGIEKAIGGSPQYFAARDACRRGNVPGSIARRFARKGTDGF